MRSHIKSPQTDTRMCLIIPPCCTVQPLSHQSQLQMLDAHIQSSCYERMLCERRSDEVQMILQGCLQGWRCIQREGNIPAFRSNWKYSFYETQTDEFQQRVRMERKIVVYFCRTLDHDLQHKTEFLTSYSVSVVTVLTDEQFIKYSWTEIVQFEVPFVLSDYNL